jgi:hypothetical protein
MKMPIDFKRTNLNIQGRLIFFTLAPAGCFYDANELRALPDGNVGDGGKDEGTSNADLVSNPSVDAYSMPGTDTAQIGDTMSPSDSRQLGDTSPDSSPDAPFDTVFMANDKQPAKSDTSPFTPDTIPAIPDTRPDSIQDTKPDVPDAIPAILCDSPGRNGMTSTMIPLPTTAYCFKLCFATPEPIDPTDYSWTCTGFTDGDRTITIYGQAVSCIGPAPRISAGSALPAEVDGAWTLVLSAGGHNGDFISWAGSLRTCP